MKLQSTDWLAQFICIALDNGCLVEVSADSDQPLTVTIEKISTLFRAYRNLTIDSFSVGPCTVIAQTPGHKIHWPTVVVKFNQSGDLLTLLASSWVGFSEGRLIDMTFSEEILAISPNEAYQNIRERWLSSRGRC